MKMNLASNHDGLIRRKEYSIILFSGFLIMVIMVLFYSGFLLFPNFTTDNGKLPSMIVDKSLKYEPNSLSILHGVFFVRYVSTIALRSTL